MKFNWRWPPKYQDRIYRWLIISSIIFSIAACCFPTEDRFTMTIGGHQSNITRQDHPLIYWGTESAFIFLAVSLYAAGCYRALKK